MAIRACHVARSQTCRKTPFRANIPMLRKDVSRTHFLRRAALRQTHEPIRVPRSRELSGDPDTRQGAVQYETVVVTADGQKERLKNAGILPCSPVGDGKNQFCLMLPLVLRARAPRSVAFKKRWLFWARANACLLLQVRTYLYSCSYVE